MIGLYPDKFSRRRKLLPLFVLACCFCRAAIPTAVNAAFVHPGIFFSQSDLDRIRTNALSNLEPWKSEYALFLTNAAGSNYVASPVTNELVGGAGQFSIRNDGGAAYDLALKWYITGDRNYFNAATNCINAWSYMLLTFDTNDNLSASTAAKGFGAAGEILQYATGASGWTPADVAQYKGMMTNRLYPAVAKSKTDYMTGNQGIDAIGAAMAIGIACDVQSYFDDSTDAWTNHPCCSVMNFILPSGQMGEAGRDQPHSSGEIMAADEWALMAWNQGVDLYRLGTNRLLAGFEYWAKYNLGNDVPFQSMTNCNYTYDSLSASDRGRLAYVYFERVYHHYVTVMGLEAPPYLQQAILRMRPNPWGLGVLRWYSGPSNAVTQLISNGAHPIISRLNNLAVSVPGDSTVNSAQLDLEPYTARSSQLWTFTHLGGNIYSVINAQNKSMDIPGGNTDTGVKIQIYYYHSSLYQQVRAMQNPDGTISFLIAGNSWGMTIAGGNMASGGLLTQDYMPATPNSPLHQEWTVGMPAISVPDAPAHLTAGEASGQIKLSWAVTAITTGYNLKRSTTNGGPYAVIASNLVAASFTDTNLSSGVTYYYVVASANQNGESTNSAQASAISGLPAPWLDADMGSVGTAGGASYDQSTGVYTQQGAGGDFGGSGDNCNFLYQSMTNNGTLIARLVFATWMGSIGKIGLMVRETTNSGSISTAILLDHGAANTPRIFNRTSTGGGTSFPGAAPSGITPPLWFKLQRIGNTFISSYSTDGLAWTPVGTNTTVMNSAMCAGLFVCSRNSALATAAFDNVSVTAMPAAPANLMATPGSALATLDWSAANNATGYNVKRSTTSGGSYVVVATNIAALSFTNTGLSNGTLYFYVVSGTNSVGESTNTPEAGVRPVSFTPVLMSASASAGGGIIQLAWPSDHMGWTLQAQTNPLNTGLDTNWVPVAYSSGTNQMFIPVVTTNGSVFYRLIYP